MDNYQLIRKQIIHEMMSLGIGSLGLIAIISLFMGAVVTLQTASNMNNPLLPGYLIGYATRESFILEMATTVMSLILARKLLRLVKVMQLATLLPRVPSML